MSATPTDVNVRGVVDGDPGRVRYRAVPRQILPLAVTFAAVSISWVLEWLAWRIGPGGRTSVTVASAAFPVIMLSVFAGEVWLLGRWVGVTLTADAAIVHNLRRRTITWDRITAVRVERFLGSQRIVLYEMSGRRTPLRMPITGFMSRDPRFAEKTAVIQQWWIARRGVAPDGTAPFLWVDDREAPLPDRLHLRVAANQWLLPVSVLIWWAMDDAIGASLTDGVGAAERILGLLVAMVLLAVAGYLYLRRGIDLTAGSMRVRGLRRRTLNWPDVSDISVESRRGGRRVVVHEANGRRTILPAPRIGLLLWDPGFQDKVHTLDRWWRHQRGASWTPTAAAVAVRPPAAPYVGPRAWQRVLVGLIWLAFGYEILVLILVGLLFAVL